MSFDNKQKADAERRKLEIEENLRNAISKRKHDIWERCDWYREAVLWVGENFGYLVDITEDGKFSVNWDKLDKEPPNGMALSILKTLTLFPSTSIERFIFEVLPTYAFNSKFSFAKDMAEAFGLSPKELITAMANVTKKDEDQLKRLMKVDNFGGADLGAFYSSAIQDEEEDQGSDI